MTEDQKAAIELIRSHPAFNCVTDRHNERVIDWSRSSFSHNLSGEQLTALQDTILKSNNSSAMSVFARDVYRADKLLLQSVVISLKDWYNFTWFATNVVGADIELLQSAIIESDFAHGMYDFAQEVAGADIGVLQAALIKSADTRRNRALVLFSSLEGADVPLIQSELIASGDLIALHNLVHGLYDNGYKKARMVDVPAVVDAMKKHIFHQTYKQSRTDALHVAHLFIKNFELRMAAQKRAERLRLKLSKQGDCVLFNINDYPGYIGDLEILVEDILDLLTKYGLCKQPFTAFVFQFDVSRRFSFEYSLSHEADLSKETEINIARLAAKNALNALVEEKKASLFLGCGFCRGQAGRHEFYCRLVEPIEAEEEQITAHVFIKNNQQVYRADAASALIKKYGDVDFTLGGNKMLPKEVFSENDFLSFFNYLALSRMKFLFDGMLDEEGNPTFTEFSEPVEGSLFGFKLTIFFKKIPDALLHHKTIIELTRELIGDRKSFAFDPVYDYAHEMAKQQEGGADFDEMHNLMAWIKALPKNETPSVKPDTDKIQPGIAVYDINLVASLLAQTTKDKTCRDKDSERLIKCFDRMCDKGDPEVSG